MNNILNFIKKFLLRLRILNLTKRKAVLEWKLFQYNKSIEYYKPLRYYNSYVKMEKKLNKINILLNETERQYNKYINPLLNNTGLLLICKITDIELRNNIYYKSVRITPIDPTKNYISYLVTVYSSEWKVDDKCVLIRYEFLTDYLLEKYQKVYKVSKNELMKNNYLLIPYNEFWVEKIGKYLPEFSISINDLK